MLSSGTQNLSPMKLQCSLPPPGLPTSPPPWCSRARFPQCGYNQGLLPPKCLSHNFYLPALPLSSLSLSPTCFPILSSGYAEPLPPTYSLVPGLQGALRVPISYLGQDGSSSPSYCHFRLEVRVGTVLFMVECRAVSLVFALLMPVASASCDNHKCI